MTKSLLLIIIPALTSAQEYCKPIPGTAGWPKPEDWQTLNHEVGGRLLVPKALGAPCHPERPEYNNATCAVLQEDWFHTQYHTLTGYSACYNDNTCLPQATGPCSTEGYPQYVINATGPEDVQAGVRFAKQHGIRLLIRGTGHDWLGRSSGPDSLSIFTHYMQGIRATPGDPRATALGGIASVKMYVGTRLGDLYDFGSRNGLTIIGGADPDVGVGGFIPGGGHGPVTAKYGLAADQVLEMEVVTADGQFRTINPQHDSDLFWALRGGGPGTYAIVISITVKAYKPVNIAVMKFLYNATARSDSFANMVAYFHTQLPHLSESGIYGYYFVDSIGQQEPYSGGDGGALLGSDYHGDLAKILYGGMPLPTTTGNIHGLFVAPELTAQQMKSLIEPMESRLRELGPESQDRQPIITQSQFEDGGDFMKYWHQHVVAQSGGFPIRIGSRLLGNDSLLGDFNELKYALNKSTPLPFHINGHLVAPAPNAQRPTGGVAGGSNAVLPAWRTTYTHVVLSRFWTPLNTTEEVALTTEIRDSGEVALRELSPNTGEYMNEADPTEPDWQQSQYGENYPRLLQIKQKYDPHGVFWCKHCVGSELWETRGPYGIENGVGQNKVRLCWRGASKKA